MVIIASESDRLKFHFENFVFNHPDLIREDSHDIRFYEKGSIDNYFYYYDRLYSPSHDNDDVIYGDGVVEFLHERFSPVQAFEVDFNSNEFMKLVIDDYTEYMDAQEPGLDYEIIWQSYLRERGLFYFR